MPRASYLLHSGAPKFLWYQGRSHINHGTITNFCPRRTSAGLIHRRTSLPEGTERPVNLTNAALDLYNVVRRLVVNDGRMTTDDYANAVAAVRLAETVPPPSAEQ
jgi:hypothetical protein